MQEALRQSGAFLPPYALGADGLRRAIRDNDRRVFEHEEFFPGIDAELFEFLLERDPAFLVERWGNRPPPTPGAVRALVALGWDPSQYDRLCRTPMHCCRIYEIDAQAPARPSDVVTTLLENRTDIDAVDLEYGETPLGTASRVGNVEMASLLLERGADPNLAEGPWGRPLRRARQHGHEEVARRLMAAGAIE